MPLEETLKDIVTRLRDNGFPNESAISQGIVLRLLQALDWPTWDTKTVWPEYQTGEGRADFALCHPSAKPVVVIEVKQPGKAEDSVRQALEYAFHTGAPMVVLTDGQTWSFYLPGEQGSYEDRRVYKLDLFERTSEEAAEVFHRYLSREGIVSGSALEAAKKEYRSRNRRSQARAAIPDAWRELVEKGDEDLVELLASAVESKTGAKPDDDDVAEFLFGLGRGQSPVPVSRRSSTPTARDAVVLIHSAAQGGASSRSGTVTLLGKQRQYGNFRDAMVETLTELANRDPTFLDRCAQHPNNSGRKRRYIARTVEALYPGRPDLYEASAKLPGGWFIGTNMNNVLKMSVMKLAAEVAGLSFGEDLAVEF
jgi:predicted type IV restriction endonuclease